MKRTALIIFLALVLISMTLLAGCVRVNIADDGESAVTRQYDFTGFTGIEAGSAFDVEVTHSDNYSVVITVSKRIADRLKVSKTGDILQIGFKEPVWNFHGRPTATITMPDISRIKLSGSSTGSVQGFTSSRSFSIDLSGASNLDINVEAGDFKAIISGASGANGYLKARSTDIELSGASHITIPGSGGDIKIIASGASQAYLENYLVANADIEFSGASRGVLNISGKLNANLSGASRLEYTGNVTLGRIDISGGSTFKPKY
jgi:hypothetical protein